MNGNSLSGRARTKLLRHQQQVGAHAHALRSSDRMLAGTLAACDAATQCEALAAHLESVQELRVALQRLDAFLESRIEHLCPPPGGDRSDRADAAPEPT
jgi:hypothetical protein